MIIFIGVMCFNGIFFVGISLLLNFFFEKKRYPLEVSGKVIEIRKRFRENSSSFLYVPVYEYFVEGERYFCVSSIGNSRSDKFQIGQLVTVCYRIGNPNSSCLLEQMGTVRILKLVFFSIGISLLLISLILGFIYFNFY